jgi:Alginate export
MKKLRGTLLAMTLPLADGTQADDAIVRPAFKLSRQDEDWSALREMAVRTDQWDVLKFIPLNGNGSAWLTLGGEARDRFEYFRHPNWGGGPQDDNGYFLRRFMLHADAHVGANFRFFTQFKSGFESDRSGGPRPTDRDDLDVHQLFAEVRVPWADHASLTLRLGRQELAFGSQRLVSVRESPNVRQSFDGVRATLSWDDWQVDAFATRPVETKSGTFDDGADQHSTFWGLYAVAPFNVVPNGKVDFYYLGLDRDSAHFDQGTARELRHSVGSRLWGQHGGWDWNFEFVYQFGAFGDGKVSAWTAASDTGFTFAHAPWSPRVGFKADVTSGDGNSSDRALETFNPLFPKGAYFGETGLIGPANHIDLHPALELHPTRAVTLTADAAFFWRESERDGVYNSGLNVARSGLNGGSRYVGAQTAVQMEWRLQRHLTWTANYSHFFAGTFLHESPPDKDVNYASTWITFRF